MCAGTAHARPTLDVWPESARAGDVVHLGIWGVDGWGVAYHLELGGENVLDGRNADYVNTTFTMPDLGQDASSVTLDATLWFGDSRTRVQQTLDYRGPALPAADPPAPSHGSTGPADAPAVAPAPQHGQSPAPSAGGKAPPHAVTPKSHAPHGHARTHHTAKPERHATSKREQHRKAHHRARDRHKHKAAKHRRSLRPAGPTGPFLKGFDGPGAESADSESPANGANAAKPSVLTSGGLYDSLTAALAIPAALTAAALILVASALLRRRRLLRR